MQRLAHSPAADPSLSIQMEDAEPGSRWRVGRAAFELNCPFVCPSMKADKPELSKNFNWAHYPSVEENEPAHVTIGGIDLAISNYSEHSELAFEAALCLRNRDNQQIAATKGGSARRSRTSTTIRMPFQALFPFHADIRTALQNANCDRRPLRIRTCRSSSRTQCHRRRASTPSTPQQLQPDQ